MTRNVPNDRQRARKALAPACGRFQPPEIAGHAEKLGQPGGVRRLKAGMIERSVDAWQSRRRRKAEYLATEPPYRVPCSCGPRWIGPDHVAGATFAFSRSAGEGHERALSNAVRTH